MFRSFVCVISQKQHSMVWLDFTLYCIVLSNVVTPTRKTLEFKHASQ